MSAEIQFHWSDAWLLLAIVYASRTGDASLDKIIAAGDAINHSIFTPSELESGLARLVAGGYIEQKVGVFSPCLKTLAYRKSRRRGRAMLSELKDVATMLRARDALAEQPSANNLDYPGFSIAAYEEAVEKYRRELSKYY